jgi:hypothetical protein
MDNQTVIRLLLIVVAAFVLFMLISYYNKQKVVAAKERFSSMASQQHHQQQPLVEMPTGATERFAAADFGAAAAGAAAAGVPMPAEPSSNDMYRPVEYGQGPRTIKDCYPKDRLSTDDLLPKDAANTKWAQANPAGQGDVKDQNFLTAGYLIGINTVGQSLRNANLQLRSEPPNPQLKVSPWSQSTIEPDANRRPLELGENC